METRKLRLALVGVGANVYPMHHPALQLPTTQVVGAADINGAAADKAAAEWGCPAFTDFHAMLDSVEADAVVVMTPHYLHAQMAMDALNAGFHVLVEKPMALDVSEADAMIETAKKAGKLLAVNFQQRTRPEIVAARKLINEGHLGKIQHVDIKITWTRTALYYSMVDWRGTWWGEGGAVLMNQGPHELDLVCHLIGNPARVFGWTRTIQHQIEAEDTIQAMVDWPSGTLGSLHISTAEAGQPQRFEIIGTGGYLAISNGKLDFKRFDVPVDTFLRTSDKAFAEPKLIPEAIEIGTGGGDHRAIHQNFYEAIVNGAPLIAEGASGIYGLELANAINYSSHSGQPVEFPVDRQAYAALLAKLQGK
jgi:predicted dehydrogenase